MDRWRIGVWFFANRLALPVANDVEQLSESLVWHGTRRPGQGVLYKISVLFSKRRIGVMEKWSLDFCQPIGFAAGKWRGATLRVAGLARCVEPGARSTVPNFHAVWQVEKWINGEMESGFLPTDWICRWQITWSNSPSRWFGAVRGAWGKEYCTKYSCSSASGKMDKWRNGVWVFANRLVLPLANVVEQRTELQVGQGAGSKVEETIRCLKR